MSLGGAFPSRELKKAVAYAHGKGVVGVCAAGNDGRGSVGYPAAYPGAIAVSATQEDEATTFYSNYGKDVDIAGPGGNTRGATGEKGGVLQNTIAIGNPEKSGYFAFKGTSMASPHVAGVAALVVGEGVTNPDMVEKILKDSARKPNNLQYSTDRYGSGSPQHRGNNRNHRLQFSEYQCFRHTGLWSGSSRFGNGFCSFTPHCLD